MDSEMELLLENKKEMAKRCKFYKAKSITICCDTCIYQQSGRCILHLFDIRDKLINKYCRNWSLDKSILNK